MKEISVFRYYLRLLALPLTFGAIILSLYGVWLLLDMPTGGAFADLIRGWFEEYGLPLVFFAAIAEGFFLVGNYFPGSFVIVFGIALSSSWGEAVTTLLVGTSGLMLAHMMNYALGRFGWYHVFLKLGFAGSIERSRQKLLARGGWAIFASYWLPSMAAVIDSAAGILRMSFKRFVLISLASSLFWNTLVMIIAYTLGERAVQLMESDSSNITILVGVIIIWILVLLVLDWRKKRGG